MLVEQCMSSIAKRTSLKAGAKRSSVPLEMVSEDRLKPTDHVRDTAILDQQASLLPQRIAIEAAQGSREGGEPSCSSWRRN